MNKLSLYILLVLFLLVSAAHAAYLQPLQTGQTVTQAAGDDGALQSGKVWPTPRFIDNRNGVVNDNLTGLVWSGDANPLVTRFTGGSVTWQQALDEIKRLNTGVYLGFSDWRLPNLNELASLVSQGEPMQNIWLNRNGFINTAAAQYWSSSSFTRDASRAWTVHMNGGSIGIIPKNGTAHVWLVRGASSQLPVTGQTVCYDAVGVLVECVGTGQDGELQTGVAWPADRFSDNGNGTIIDNLTGLVWPQNANPALDAQLARNSGGRVLWPDALEFVANLNRKAYLGYSDWRLPNRNEFLSLVNYAESTPGVQLNMAGVGAIQEHYWSSGSAAANLTDAWNVTMRGEVAALNKYDFQFGSYIWPVRNAIEGSGVKTITVSSQAAAAAVAALSVSTVTLPAGTVGTAYSQTLAATGGTTPYTWTKTVGSLPAGLTLSTAGVISGIPTTAATSTFTVQVKDKVAATATRSLTITINTAAPLSITTSSLADGYLTTAYSQTLSATGGKTAYSWAITTGTLPAGLSLAATTGVISGKPTTTGTSTITIQVKDANAATATKTLSIVVYALPVIATTALPAAGVGTAYNQILTATGGKASLIWSVSAGTLPVGLTLNATSGLISGTPTTAATSSVTFKITDANAKTVTKALSITVSATPLSITTTMLSNGAVGVSYSQTLTATGGKLTYTWSKATGSLPLPAGLTLSAAGVISGKPTTAGTYSFTVQVKDANSAIATMTLTLIISLPLTIDTSQPVYGTAGVSYSYKIPATGGSQPYSWSILNGTLPVGLTLNASTGVISGEPTTSGWTDMITIQVKDASNATATGDFWFYNYSAPQIVTNVTYDTYVGFSYGLLLIPTGGLAPYTWSIVSGSLPVGLSLNPATGKISGTATTIGNNTFTVQIKDSNNATGTKPFTIAITSFGSINGVVTDQATGAPLAGVAVNLNLSGITNHNIDDLIYTCNNGALIDPAELSVFAENDGVKYKCDSAGTASNIMLFKVRNPYGTSDSFTVKWNGIGAFNSGYEYLAQEFKPIRSGLLTTASFHLPKSIVNSKGPMTGTLRVMLKSKLGGDFRDVSGHKQPDLCCRLLK